MRALVHSLPDPVFAPGHVFTSVLVGVDASPESIVAARQAARLVHPLGTLTVLAAWDVPPPAVGAPGTVVSYELDADSYRRPAQEAAANAAETLAEVGSVTTKVARGRSWDALIEAAAASATTLIAVGSHGRGRMRGIVLGSTTTVIVHSAPCSVLVAREASGRFPRRIVVGVDGSPESAAAHAVADHLAQRFDAELWPVVAHGGKGVDEAVVGLVVGNRHEDSPDEPVKALVAAAADADLLVVGSRGLHGFKALGSVSERVAHQARCSTLIVRPPAVEEGLR